MERLLERRLSFESGPLVFTDDYNPIDFYDLRLREKTRHSTLSAADKSIVVD